MRRAEPNVVAATERAIKAAEHLGDLDAGAVETLRVLARKIDTEQMLRGLALRYAEEHDQKPPSVDNVSIPTYLKFCESLGLTPSGRGKMPAAAPPKKSVLASVSGIPRPA